MAMSGSLTFPPPYPPVGRSAGLNILEREESLAHAGIRPPVVQPG